MRVLAFALSFAVLLAMPLHAADMPQPTEQTFQTFITIQPTAKDENHLLGRPSPYTYTCKAEVYVPGEKPIAKEMVIYVEPGKPALKIFERDGMTIEFRASVTKERDHALTSVTVMENGVPTHRQTQTTWLPRDLPK